MLSHFNFDISQNAIFSAYTFISNKISYVVTSITYRLVGDLFNIRINALKKEAKEKKEGPRVAKRSLGMFGNFWLVNPRNTQELVALANLGTRRPYIIFKIISGGTNFFAEETNRDTLMHRHMTIAALGDQRRYAHDALMYCKQFFRLDQTSTFKQETISHFVNCIFAKNLLGITKLPDNTTHVIRNYMETAEEMSDKTIGGHSLGVLFFARSLRTARNQYLQWAKNILRQEKNNILHTLHHYHPGQHNNLLINSIISVIKKETPHFTQQDIFNYLRTLNEESIQKYLDHPDVLVSLSALSAAEVLVKGLKIQLDLLCDEKDSQDDALEELCQEIKENFPSDEMIPNLINENLDNLIYLASFKFALFTKNPPISILPRYYAKNTPISKDLTIPAKTTVVIDLIDPTSKATDLTSKPFTAGPRMCPARENSYTIAMIWIVYLLKNFILSRENGEFTITPLAKPQTTLSSSSSYSLAPTIKQA